QVKRKQHMAGNLNQWWAFLLGLYPCAAVAKWHQLDRHRHNDYSDDKFSRTHVQVKNQEDAEKSSPFGLIAVGTNSEVLISAQ
ncbi:uncharacterized protein METZ01_LOCUS158733, partial [marine metagenome]